MKRLIIIAIVGMPGVGKSVAAEFFRTKNIPVLRFGDQTDIGLEEFKLDKSEKNERWYREKLRKELGMAAMAIKINSRIEEQAKDHDVIILDGLYSWEEYLYLREKYPDLKILCIYAPPAIRHQRLSIRPIRPLTHQEAKSRDIAEIQNLNKGGPIAIADYVIKNEKDKETFYEELEKFYSSII